MTKSLNTHKDSSSAEKAFKKLTYMYSSIARIASCQVEKLLTSFSSAADIISAVEFNQSGKHLATGDRGGRVVVFEHIDSSPVETLPHWMFAAVWLSFHKKQLTNNYPACPSCMDFLQSASTSM